ncbi:hypothetical protein [Fodinicola feengrottensis]|uniref:hypothetical protein n=1 Tax=Fodinicola feengrottensis TaxID=435914 RepID=UPI002441C085|nr:hypothetical protein [Fodinicola feengrottensis]
MTKWPLPSMAALLVPPVYHCSSWLLPALFPVSCCHLPVSTPLPAGPEKSSVKVAAAGARRGGRDSLRHQR